MHVTENAFKILKHSDYPATMGTRKCEYFEVIKKCRSNADDIQYAETSVEGDDFKYALFIHFMYSIPSNFRFGHCDTILLFIYLI